MSPPALRVRFRCRLPSAFATKISLWQTPHCPMAGPRRFSKASLRPSGDHTGHDGRPTRCAAHEPALAAAVGVHDVELRLQERPARTRLVHSDHKRDPRWRRRGHGTGRRSGGGRSVARLGAAVEDGQDHDHCERHDRGDGPVDPPAAALALPRLLDQRLDESLDLLAIDGIARERRARRRQ